MDSLIAKLTSLGYEFFGVILPGVVASLGLGLLWAALSPAIDALAGTRVFAVSSTAVWAAAVADPLNLRVLVPAVALWYFLGHLCNWWSRVRSVTRANPGRAGTIIGTLAKLQIPRPDQPYEENLQPLFDVVSRRLSAGGAPLTWRQFYPVAKAVVASRRRHSLISTYQNKYTLHRAIATAMAWLCWGALLGGLIGLASLVWHRVSPQWWLLGLLLAVAAILGYVFCSSYLYAWRLFGDSVVTETYSLLVEGEDHAVAE